MSRKRKGPRADPPKSSGGWLLVFGRDEQGAATYLCVEIESTSNDEVDALLKAGRWVAEPHALHPERRFELRRGSQIRIRVVVSDPNSFFMCTSSFRLKWDVW